MKKLMLLAGLTTILAAGGCATPNTHTADLQLKMTTAQVREIMGKPFNVRAAKVYENGDTMEIWEYVAPVFSAAAFSDKYDKTIWVVFNGGKVVQWGEPGDLSGLSSLQGTPVASEYIGKRTK